MGIGFGWLKGKEFVEKTKLVTKLNEALKSVTSRGVIRKKETGEFISVNINTSGTLTFTLGVGETDEQCIELTRFETELFLEEIRGRLE